MSSTLYGINRKNGNLDMNEMGKTILDYLGWGLKKKHGVYAPMSKEDCKLLARILRNKADWLDLGKDQVHCVQDAFNIVAMYDTIKNYMTDKDTIAWIRKIADWFEHCGGLRDTNGYNEE